MLILLSLWFLSTLTASIMFHKYKEKVKLYKDKLCQFNTWYKLPLTLFVLIVGVILVIPVLVINIFRKLFGLK